VVDLGEGQRLPSRFEAITPLGGGAFQGGGTGGAAFPAATFSPLAPDRLPCSMPPFLAPRRPPQLGLIDRAWWRHRPLRNCVGVPHRGRRKVAFDPSYSGNPLGEHAMRPWG